MAAFDVSSRYRLMRCAVMAAMACLVPRQAHAQLLPTCSITAQPLVFGAYMSDTTLTSSGTVSLTCTALLSLLVSYSLAAGTGTSGTSSARYMTGASGAHLAYQLYTTSSYSTVWSSAAPLTGSYLLGVGTVTNNLTFYGRVLAGQYVAPGAYSDSLLLTLTY